MDNELAAQVLRYTRQRLEELGSELIASIFGGAKINLLILADDLFLQEAGLKGVEEWLLEKETNACLTDGKR
jgi:hypothetical protein